MEDVEDIALESGKNVDIVEKSEQTNDVSVKYHISL